jgi:hypothetical protein
MLEALSTEFIVDEAFQISEREGSLLMCSSNLSIWLSNLRIWPNNLLILTINLSIFRFNLSIQAIIPSIGKIRNKTLSPLKKPEPT